MVPKKKTIECEVCGSKATLEVVPDDWKDAPASFTITRTCSARCKKTYMPVSAEKMHDLTGLSTVGWSS
ncbi:MAG TPA: hypothetical protein VEL79_19250 [Vicinamibacterales bacterium]|nr:hypothetical protein [Vicinamibacterales bacterium]